MTVKDLAAYIAALPEEERILQFGKKAADPLQGLSAISVSSTPASRGA